MVLHMALHRLSCKFLVPQSGKSKQSTHTRTCTHIQTHIQAHMHVHMCARTSTHTSTHTCTYAHIHKHTHTHIHAIVCKNGGRTGFSPPRMDGTASNILFDVNLNPEIWHMCVYIYMHIFIYIYVYIY